MSVPLTWKNIDGVNFIECDICDATTGQEGPWCDLYCDEKRVDCYWRASRKMRAADARGDGPLVNAVIWHMRKRYGPNGPWW